MAMTWA